MPFLKPTINCYEEPLDITGSCFIYHFILWTCKECKFKICYNFILLYKNAY